MLLFCGGMLYDGLYDLLSNSSVVSPLNSLWILFPAHRHGSVHCAGLPAGVES